ncbi:MAG: DUF3744 domain-containing protein [Spirochaetaceae bacterium]|jgi:energy-coupling factor transport system ATP-binding protein|nr:DUF3744 domain-containing protein [Spirochaetaceae bacterium]
MCVSAIRFEDFTFTYKAQAEPTVSHISLSIAPGEKILIAGPSGSGKSTLAHCINGLIPHAFKGRIQGTVSLMGEDIRGMSIFAVSKKVGTVLQDTDGQFVGLRVGEDIAFVAENDCVPPEEMRRRVMEVAGMVRLEDQLTKAPQQLSGGQKQRVSLAGVLMDKVEILLFDEPLANLDPATGVQTIELIDRLHRETGKTIIIVEHRLEEVLHRSVDRIVVMEQGRIKADLPPADLLATGMLRETGIREPLYLSALRYAGTEIRAEMHPESLETLTFDPARLRAWDQERGNEAPEPPRSPLLTVRDLGFSYPRDPNRQPVLEGVSFTLAAGEWVSLVGKNGAGKSTLAKLICGFNHPSTGSISLEGQNLADLSIKERSQHLGYVMQNPNQMISFPLIFDEVALGLRNRGMGEKEIHDRVMDTLAICGLHPFRKWPVSALSYGQKKRLTIAAILVLGPSLIILDEPTAGQDFRHYRDIMEFLRKLNREQGTSFLFMTHDMHLMLEYTRRALVLVDGKLLADAAPATILTEPDLIAAARLKQTSLYNVALRAGLSDPVRFVGHFIAYERLQREAAPA